MRLAIEFLRTHLWQSVILVSLLLVGGVVDSIGLSTFLPQPGRTSGPAPIPAQRC